MKKPRRAAIFNHLLYWISKKSKGQAEDKIKAGEVYWYGTAEEICAGLDYSWSVNKVRKEVKALVDAKLIGQRRNPVKGWDQTRHYFIGMEQGEAIRKACEQYDICLRCLGLTSDVLHLLNLVNAFHRSGNCNCQKEEMELPNKVDPITKSGTAIPKVSSKDTNKERNISTPTVVAKKPDIFLDIIIEKVSEALEDESDRERYREQIKVIYAASAANAARFTQVCRDALKAAQSITTEECQNFNYKSQMDYFFWNLEYTFNVRQPV